MKKYFFLAITLMYSVLAFSCEKPFFSTITAKDVSGSVADFNFTVIEAKKGLYVLEYFDGYHWAPAAYTKGTIKKTYYTIRVDLLSSWPVKFEKARIRFISKHFETTSHILNIR